MESNNFISVSYQLYDASEGKSELIEQTTDERPFIFVSGMGATLPSFEENIAHLAQGEKFDFLLEPSQAYGDRYDERILDLDKAIFCVDGQFDAQHVEVGAIIPLQNEDGNRFNAVVMEIGDSKVKVDLNHPLAGKTLHFQGEVLVSREATAEEVAGMAKLLGGEGGGGCSGCNGHCGDGGCGEGDCGDGGCKGGCCK